MTFGEMLREWRKEAKMSQRELAEHAGINHTYLSKVETGTLLPPSEKAIEAMAAATGKDATTLLIASGRVPRDVREKLLARPDLIRRVREW